MRRRHSRQRQPTAPRPALPMPRALGRGRLGPSFARLPGPAGTLAKALAARDPEPLAPPPGDAHPSERQLRIHLELRTGTSWPIARPLRSWIRRFAFWSAAFRPSAVRSCQLAGFIAPLLTVELVLTTVGLLSLAQDLPADTTPGSDPDPSHQPHPDPPDKVILRQPLNQRRRHQQQLTALTRNEISSHVRSV